jgi:hypothetical protein
MTPMQKIDDMTMDKRMLDDFQDIFGPGVKQVFEVWTEGFNDSGNQQGAMFHGRYSGETFEDALVAFKASIEDKRSRNLVNLRTRSYWGCRFFDNGAEAKVKYG